MLKNVPVLSKNIKNEETFSIIGKNVGSSGKRKHYGTSSRESQLTTSPEGSSDSLYSSPYPIAVIFVLMSKMFEAFAANGIRSILALYLRDSLNFSEEFSTAILHTFNFFSQVLPIIGAILADSYLGNARTIFLFCIPYAIGYIGTFMGSLPFTFATNFLIFASLFLIATGNGCLRACITALGGHQFKMPHQKALLDRYFSLYYFFYYAGILMGKIIPAYVRTEVQFKPFCKKYEECYPAVFAVIAIAFFVSWLIFLFGIPYFKREFANGDNTMLRVCGCISYAIYRKVTGKSKGMAWLRGSVGKYSPDFVNDVSIFLKVIKLFAPIPIYYALLVQQDSTWTYQATQMDTRIKGYRIPADQFKAIGPIMLLIQIPVWQKIVLPLMKRRGFHLSSLESVAIGGLCAAFSYIGAGFLQHRIDADPFHPPSILWQLPMFFFVMIGEVLISVPGLQFCYTHAPSSMKSVLTAVWFANNALGNLIVVIFTQIQIVQNKSLEFFFYAFMMFAGTIIFTLLAQNFKLNNPDDIDRPLDEQTIEAYIYVEDAQSSNLEENYLDDKEEDDNLVFC